jgi:hypothetical protein
MTRRRQQLTLMALNILLCSSLATAAAPQTGNLDWVIKCKYGGILKTVATAEPVPYLYQVRCNPGPGAARDLFNALITNNPGEPARSSAT